MRLLPRDTSLNAVASALSLAAANYKPVPQLSSANKGTDIANMSTSDASQAQGRNSTSYQVQSTLTANNWTATHNTSNWGVPSTLFVPVESHNKTSVDAEVTSKLASSRKVGPGGCPFSDGYTPTGGWDALPPPTFPAFDPVRATIMRYRQQQGVNLGAWFVQEGWMEPRFMSCALHSKQSEYDLLRGFGTSQTGLTSARAYMEEHWDTWITEDDFAQLAKIGINTVRLPIGYWSAGPYFTHHSPFERYGEVYELSWRYVARAINWAAKYDIGVLVDLHGAYGSQNGQPHSGLDSGKIEWYEPFNQALTTELLVWLAKEISDVTNVIGIQLLNEPQNRESYWRWLPTAMDAMRAASPSAKHIPLYFHDAFNLAKGAAFVSTRNDFVVSDHHAYYVYTPADQALSVQGHIEKLDTSITDKFTRQSKVARGNLVVGEWSCALAESSIRNSKNRQQDQREFCRTQQEVWQTKTAGWTFWSYKMEGCAQNDGWCFRSARKKFLRNDFSAWGSELSSALLGAVSNITSDVLGSLSPLLDEISRIRLPTSSSSFKSLFAIDGIDGDDGEVGPHGFAHSLYTPTPSSQPKQAERGVGGYTSLARRQVQLDRCATQVAHRAFSDGFYTSRILASSTTSPSRLGFATQYQQDTFQSYVDAGIFKRSEQSAYNAQFSAGIKAAEKAIEAIVASYARKA
ncbi:Glycoside hydrolase, family 5 [Kalmanozyma brasiliensis GHG001]|uniref:Glycoside hydrolase family 5 domain-containing protein n=1 Tax=Kalmanozyma brasiliensis (strain GHG001) TaxID=1365824 RepID=V5ET84_KALBG|nr:Glycoside hydrolase, family 5 [Kalmanozyma brasiliensis GHG001]EST06233.1 Glycoside hydrolase, family 5 [Kalmanozyma brasiliensis GHG001]